MLNTNHLMIKGKELARRSALVNNIRAGLMRIMNTVKEETESRRLTEELLGLVSQEIELNREWREFEQALVEKYEEFIVNLMRSCPELAEGERRVFLLTHAGFSTKEIADLLFITIKTVQTRRYRGRRKMKRLSESRSVPGLYM